MAIALREALLEFVADLRAAEVRISVAESLDAMRAVAAAGLHRGRMCEALRAALIKDEADNTIFDQVFARRFGAPRAHPGVPRPSHGAPVGVSGSGNGGGAGAPSPPPSADPRPAEARPSEESPTTDWAMPAEARQSSRRRRPPSGAISDRDTARLRSDSAQAATGEHGADDQPDE